MTISPRVSTTPIVRQHTDANSNETHSRLHLPVLQPYASPKYVCVARFLLLDRKGEAVVGFGAFEKVGIGFSGEIRVRIGRTVHKDGLTCP